jgi:hypothetical protein
MLRLLARMLRLAAVATTRDFLTRIKRNKYHSHNSVAFQKLVTSPEAELFFLA